MNKLQTWIRQLTLRVRRSKFPKNPELESAMHEVALQDTEQTREVLYKAFLRSELIAPGTATPAALGPGTRIADGNMRVKLALTELSPGKLLLPVFTNEETFLHFYAPNSPWVSMPAPALFKFISKSNIAEVRVNPFPTGKKMLKPGGILFRHEYEVLADRLLPQLSSFQKDTRTFKLKDPEGVLSNPQSPKEPLPGRVYLLLEQELQKHPEVKAAYHYGLPNQFGPQRPIVGLEFFRDPPAKEVDELMSAIGRKLKEYPDPDFGLDMCAPTREQLSRLKGLVKPFYGAP